MHGVAAAVQVPKGAAEEEGPEEVAGAEAAAAAADAGAGVGVVGDSRWRPVDRTGAAGVAGDLGVETFRVTSLLRSTDQPTDSTLYLTFYLLY